jgi:hypothetical protein
MGFMHWTKSLRKWQRRQRRQLYKTHWPKSPLQRERKQLRLRIRIFHTPHKLCER